MTSFNLRRIALVAGQEALPCELLGDGAAPLSPAPFLDIAQHGAADANRVDAGVLVEPLILDRDDRLDQVRRDLFERNLDALFLEDREDRSILGVIDCRRLGHVAEPADGIPPGQPSRYIHREPRQCRDGKERSNRQRARQRQEYARTTGKERRDSLEVTTHDF